MVRSNKDRLQANMPNTQQSTTDNIIEEQPHSLQFIVPVEMVDLPSKGKFYLEGHPLHNKESIEIRHMTAKEEDILTSVTLLEKGLALDKVVQNVIVNKKIKVDDMLVGDKNSIIIWSRVFGYGAEYATKITCPSCTQQFEHEFNLENIGIKDFEAELERYDVQYTENNTFLMQLPRSKYMLEFRLLTGKDEKTILGNKRSMNSLQLLEAITVSINEQTDRFFLKRALSSLPIMDATILKRVYAKAMPDIDLSQEVTCPNCEETTEMGVPLDADFFWPNF